MFVCSGPVQPDTIARKESRRAGIRKLAYALCGPLKRLTKRRGSRGHLRRAFTVPEDLTQNYIPITVHINDSHSRVTRAHRTRAVIKDE